MKEYIKKKLPLTLIFNKDRMQKKIFNKAIDISLELGVKFFQFGDGFGSTLNIYDLKEIQKSFDDRRKIKVVGKIRDIESTIKLLDNGADNIGSSYFYEIFNSIK